MGPVHWLKTFLGGLLPRRRARELGLAPDMLLGVGVDRLDYTKGSRSVSSRSNACSTGIRIPRALYLRATGGAEPRRIDRYRDLNENLVKVVDRINDKFRKNGYRPIILHRAHTNADRLPLLPRGGCLLRQQPARRHEPGRQGICRGQGRRTRRAGLEPVLPARRAS